jgi:hypothetical protein
MKKEIFPRAIFTLNGEGYDMTPNATVWLIVNMTFEPGASPTPKALKDTLAALDLAETRGFPKTSRERLVKAARREDGPEVLRLVEKMLRYIPAMDWLTAFGPENFRQVDIVAAPQTLQ